MSLHASTSLATLARGRPEQGAGREGIGSTSDVPTRTLGSKR